MSNTLQKYLRWSKLLIISKNYFENWFSAALRYLLCSKGLLKDNTLNIKRRDGTSLTISSKLYSLLLNGLFNRLFKDLKCQDHLVVTERSLIPFKELLASDMIFEALKNGWSYIRNYGYWFKDNVKFKHMRGYILEIYDYEEHRNIDVEKKFVIDVGAGYGETAVYFILRGAEHVIAIEPCPDVFNELLENLRLNNIMDKVSPINKAVASVHDRINIECPSGNFVVDTISLRDVAKNINLDDAVLKMDCEGCEYDTILHTDPQDLKIFKEIIIEYHNGYHELKRFLEDSGFNTKIKPIRSFPQSIEKQGYLIAKRDIR